MLICCGSRKAIKFFVEKRAGGLEKQKVTEASALEQISLYNSGVNVFRNLHIYTVHYACKYVCFSARVGSAKCFCTVLKYPQFETISD